MIVTANLAKGAVKMARRKTIVKRLNAIQNFGAMDMLCTDKTGTLTQNKIILERHLNVHGKDDLPGSGIRLAEQLLSDGIEEPAGCRGPRLCAAAQHRPQTESTTKKSTKFLSTSCGAVCRWSCAMAMAKTLWFAKARLRRCCPCAVSADDNGGATGGVIPFTDRNAQGSASGHSQTKPEGLRALAVGL